MIKQATMYFFLPVVLLISFVFSSSMLSIASDGIYDPEEHIVNPDDIPVDDIPPRQYKVCLMGNGGSTSGGEEGFILYVNCGETYQLPSNPFTRRNWMFDCWSTTVDGVAPESKFIGNTGRILDLAEEGKVVILYALWFRTLYQNSIDLDEALRRIKALTASLADLQSRLNILESSSDTYEGDINDLKIQIQSLEQYITQFEEKINDIINNPSGTNEEEINQLSERIIELESEMNVLRDRISQSEIAGGSTSVQNDIQEDNSIHNYYYTYETSPIIPQGNQSDSSNTNLESKLETIEKRIDKLIQDSNKATSMQPATDTSRQNGSTTTNNYYTYYPEKKADIESEKPPETKTEYVYRDTEIIELLQDVILLAEEMLTLSLETSEIIKAESLEKKTLSHTLEMVRLKRSVVVFLIVACVMILFLIQGILYRSIIRDIKTSTERQL